MNKSLLCLFLGTVIGAAGGFFAAKSHYKKKFEKELETASEEMEEYYRGTNEYSRVYREDIRNEEKEEPSKMSKEEKESFKKAAKEKQNKVEYNKMYHSSAQNEIDEEEARLTEEARECDEWHERNKHRAPEILTEGEVEDLPSHVREEPLYYYIGDGTLTDDFDSVVDEPALLIGDSLTKFNFDDPESEQDMMYVMNYQHDVCYIVQKISGEFQS